MKQRQNKKLEVSSLKFDNYKQWKEQSFKMLISYAERLGNGAVFKRLGFLAEGHPEGYDLAVACKKKSNQRQCEAGLFLVDISSIHFMNTTNEFS